MGVIKMNMSQGKIENDQTVTTEYGDEIMSSGWIPVVALAQLVPDTKHKSFPVELVGVDIEIFLRKMYE